MLQLSTLNLGRNKNFGRELFESPPSCVIENFERVTGKEYTPENLEGYLCQEIKETLDETIKKPKKGLKIKDINLDAEIKVQSKKLVKSSKKYLKKKSHEIKILHSKGKRKTARELKKELKDYKGYLIFDIVRTTKAVYDRFHYIVRIISNPFGETKDRAFYRNIVIFFLHLINGMIYSYRYNKETDQLEFKYSPISYNLGIAKLEHVFDTQMLTEEGVPIARTSEGKVLDRLVRCELIEYKPHEFYGVNHKNNKCREFILKPEIFNFIFQCSPEELYDHAEYLSTNNRKYNLAKGHNQKVSNESNIDYLIICINKKATRSKPQFPEELNGKGKQIKETKEFYTYVVGRMRPLEINISEGIRQVIDHQKIAAQSKTKNEQTYNLLISLQIEQALWAMISRGCDLISGDLDNPDAEDIIVAYYPKYKVAGVGGRLFEEGGGFQTLPAYVKGVILSGNMINYDIESCQLNILNKLLGQYGFSNDLVNTLCEAKKLEQFLKKLDIDKDTFKKMFYGLLFSAGNGPHPSYLEHSDIGKWLLFKFEPKKAKRIYSKFYRVTKELRADLKKLANSLIDDLQYGNQYGAFIKNVMGIPLRLETGINSRITLRTPQNLKQVLAHVIQGIETHYTLRCIVEHGGSACEHDGFVLNIDTPLTTKHEYLKMIKKPFKTSERVEKMGSHSVGEFLKKNRRSWDDLKSFDESGLFPVEGHVKDMIKKKVTIDIIEEQADDVFDYTQYSRSHDLKLPDFDTTFNNCLIGDKIIDLNKINMLILETISGLELYNLRGIKGKTLTNMKSKYKYLAGSLSDFDKLSQEAKDRKISNMDTCLYAQYLKKVKCLSENNIEIFKTEITKMIEFMGNANALNRSPIDKYIRYVFFMYKKGRNLFTNTHFMLLKTLIEKSEYADKCLREDPELSFRLLR